MIWGMIMFKLINKIIFFARIFVLLFAFIMTLYIMLMLNSYYKNEIVNLFLTCLPLLLILIIFVTGFFFQIGEDNFFFNLSSLFALVAILIIDVRAIADTNMVMWIKGNINFYYFKNNILLLKMLGYGIFFGNLLIIYHDYNLDKKKHTL